jgi:hypothetical protein
MAAARSLDRASGEGRCGCVHSAAGHAAGVIWGAGEEYRTPPGAHLSAVCLPPLRGAAAPGFPTHPWSSARGSAHALENPPLALRCPIARAGRINPAPGACLPPLALIPRPVDTLKETRPHTQRRAHGFCPVLARASACIGRCPPHVHACPVWGLWCSTGAAKYKIALRFPPRLRVWSVRFLPGFLETVPLAVLRG